MTRIFITAILLIITFCNACNPQLKITEVMFNPGISLDQDGEYIEFCNVGIFPIDLGGFFIDEASYLPEAYLSPIPIYPNGCHTIGRSNNTTPSSSCWTTTMIASIWPTIPASFLTDWTIS